MADIGGNEIRLPAASEVFVDPREDSRALRVTWHPEAGLVVLSVWRDRTCAASFRLPIEQVPVLISALSTGLVDAYDEVRAARERERRAAG